MITLLKKLHITARRTHYVLLAVCFCGFVFSVAWTRADTMTSLSQNINDFYSAVFTDEHGEVVDGPTIDLETLTVAREPQRAYGTLGDSDLRIRVTTASALIDTWTLSIAAADGASALWRSNTAAFDYNDPNNEFDGHDVDYVGGQMVISPQNARVRGLSGTTLDKISLGVQDAFYEGRVDSIDLLNAAFGADNPGEWEIVGLGIEQSVPAGQTVGVYYIDMLLTVS